MQDNNTTIDENIIVYRYVMDRPPTPEDRTRRFGLKEFLGELRKYGWADERNCGLKNFRIQQKGHIEEGNHYIEWRAILAE